MVGGGLQHFSVSPRPHGFGFGAKGFGAKGLGPGLDNNTRYYNIIRGLKKFKCKIYCQR